MFEYIKENKASFFSTIGMIILLYIMHHFFYFWSGFWFFIMSCIYYVVSSVTLVLGFFTITSLLDAHYRKVYKITNWRKVRKDDY